MSFDMVFRHSELISESSAFEMLNQVQHDGMECLNEL